MIRALVAPRRSVDVFTPREQLSALKLVQSSWIARRLANVLLLLLLGSAVAMLLLPWQQSAKGTGRVTAYVPQERQQTVMSPVKGIVSRVADGLREGSEEGLVRAINDSKHTGRIQRVGSMLTLFFNDGSPVENFDQVKACDHAKFAKFFHGMQEKGVYLPPSGYEAWFVSATHDADIIRHTVEAADTTLKLLD